jgi:hypothetical protein
MYRRQSKMQDTTKKENTSHQWGLSTQSAKEKEEET